MINNKLHYLQTVLGSFVSVVVNRTIELHCFDTIQQYKCKSSYSSKNSITAIPNRNGIVLFK